MDWKKWIGIVLIGLSCVFFVGLLIIPFIQLSIGVKAILALAFLIAMEASFWVGTLIIGKQVLARFWRKR